MAESATAVQLVGRAKGASPWLKVSGDDEEIRPLAAVSSEKVERLQLDVSVDDSEFLYRLSRYRNALAKVQGIRLRKQNSRKSIGEDFIAMQCQRERTALQAMFDACGPLPDGKDEKAMKAYAKTVVDWDAKRSKKNSR